MKVLPIGSRLLVKRVKEEATAGGIILPDDQQDHGLIGEVIEIGDSVARQIEVGDVVLFGRYAGQSVERNISLNSFLDGEYEDVMLMVDEDIIAIVCKDDNHVEEVKARGLDEGDDDE